MNQHSKSNAQVVGLKRYTVTTVPPQEPSGVYMIKLSFEDLQSEQPPLKRRAPSPEPKYEAKPKRYRTFFQKQQVDLMEEEYQINNFLIPHRRIELAKKLNLSENCLKIWFQNRRRKDARLAKILAEGVINGGQPIAVSSMMNQTAVTIKSDKQIVAASSPSRKLKKNSPVSTIKSEVSAITETKYEQSTQANDFTDLLDQLVVCLPETIEKSLLRSKEEILEDLFKLEQTYEATKNSPPTETNYKPSCKQELEDNGFSINPYYLSNEDSMRLITDTSDVDDLPADLNLSFNLNYLI